MSLEDIATLPVEKLAAKDAHCHLWTTTNFCEAGYALLRGWGFTPKCQLIWDKGRGTGHYWRVSHEILLLGVRGKATHFRQNDLPSVYRCPSDRYTHWGEHSRKPDEVRYMVEQASPGPYLELFGREACDGWTVWGNEL